MRTQYLQTGLAVLAAGGAVLGVLYVFAQSPARAAEVTLYKSPQCGCCQNYAEYLEDNGHTVTVKSTDRVVTMSREAGIPDTFQGCHLAFIEGYAVSGHVPMSTIERLLSERPDIKGISLPGMPAGSPGMSGSKTGPFRIYEVGSGEPKLYSVE